MLSSKFNILDAHNWRLVLTAAKRINKTSLFKGKETEQGGGFIFLNSVCV